MTGAASRGTYFKKCLIKSRRLIPALAGVTASFLFVFCILSVPVFSDNSLSKERAGAAAVYDVSDPATAERNAAQTESTEAASEAQAEETQNGQEQEKGSGRYFINKTHIIISCLVAFALAVLIAILQANKKFK